METNEDWQVLPTYKLHRVAARYRQQAVAAPSESVREELLAMAENYEKRVVDHLVSEMA